MIDLMILFVLLKRDFTMYGIHKRILELFCAFTNPSFGALKPALVRLEKNGCIKSSKIMSDGGKLSVFYSVTDEGLIRIKELLLGQFSENPLQFISDAKVKLCCASFLKNEELSIMLEQIKHNAYSHRAKAQSVLEDEYTPLNFYQKIVMDNTICEYNNFISMVEGFEKENGRNR